jgi:hypothetical protein
MGGEVFISLVTEVYSLLPAVMLEYGSVPTVTNIALNYTHKRNHLSLT